MPAQGVPYAMTDKAKAAILNALRTGNYRENAAAYAGVSRSALYDWIRRGKRDAKSPETADSVYARFWREVEVAEAAAVSVALAKIWTLGGKDWRAFAWWLERKHAELWGSQTREIKELQREVGELRKMLAEFMGAGGGGGGGGSRG